jgi:hypothetical protein
VFLAFVVGFFSPIVVFVLVLSCGQPWGLPACRFISLPFTPSGDNPYFIFLLAALKVIV